MTYNAIFEGDDATGWSGYVPDLPGVAVTGDTLEEARSLMPTAIEWHLQGMREDGVPIPAPTPLVLEAIVVSAA